MKVAVILAVAFAGLFALAIVERRRWHREILPHLQRLVMRTAAVAAAMKPVAEAAHRAARAVGDGLLPAFKGLQKWVEGMAATVSTTDVAIRFEPDEEGSSEVTRTETALAQGELVKGELYGIRWKPSAGRRISSGEVKDVDSVYRFMGYIDSPAQGRSLSLLDLNEDRRVVVPEPRVVKIVKHLGSRDARARAKAKGKKKGGRR